MFALHALYRSFYDMDAHIYNLRKRKTIGLEFIGFSTLIFSLIVAGSLIGLMPTIDIAAKQALQQFPTGVIENGEMRLTPVQTDPIVISVASEGEDPIDLIVIDTGVEITENRAGDVPFFITSKHIYIQSFRSGGPPQVRAIGDIVKDYSFNATTLLERWGRLRGKIPFLIPTILVVSNGFLFSIYVLIFTLFSYIVTRFLQVSSSFSFKDRYRWMAMASIPFFALEGVRIFTGSVIPFWAMTLIPLGYGYVSLKVGKVASQ